MSAPLLRAADIRLVHLVAAHRRGEPAPALDEAALDSLLRGVAADEGAGTFPRAAEVARGVLRLVDEPALARQMCVLALCAQLSLEGYTLIAPQGVVAGMITSLQKEGDAAALGRWLEDRALPAGTR
jgi:hypothetical protein